ncbi:MAG: hypothetical protein HY290_07090 [Planctomycetia bacterium]|nr:hypothetical protein [Planctomycetia bacterium]
MSGARNAGSDSRQFEVSFHFRVTGDGRGHMAIRCVVRDQPGIGNTLDCDLVTDQTFLQTTVAELAAAVKEFPIVGKP